MLRDDEKTNFDTLKRAADQGCMALLESHRISDGKRVALVCAVSPPHGEQETYDITPFAEMIEGNPFEIYEPPYNDEEKDET